ncbi:hypothetical protein [Lacticaseibacillus absianus]|uniref:hypothetical protein n=1 Tax=Lacticaseibacillus absianus TaxID=2729623 RepID=UPI0015C98AA4|nr:hypothetical protein [Lacticaseibacillus absianus]
MKAILRLDHGAVWRSRKNRFLLVLWTVIGIGFVFAAQTLQLGDLKATLSRSHALIQINAGQIESMVVPTKGPKRATAIAINRQAALFGQTYARFMFDDEAGTQDGLIALAKAQVKGAQGGYPGLKASSLPSEAAATRTLLVTQWLRQHGQPLIRQVSDAGSSLTQAWPLWLALLPIMALAIACDGWLMMSEHRTVTATLPVGLGAQAVSKVLTRLGLTLLAMGLSGAATLIVGALSGGWGHLSYPTAVALGDQLQILPLGAVLGLGLLDAVLVTLFIASAMLVVNVLTRNVYLSAMTGAAALALPWLTPGLTRALWWLPLAGLAPSRVFDGTLQAQAGNWALGIEGSALLLVLWTLIMLGWFRWLAARQVG